MEKYFIKEATYKEYVELNGKKLANCPQALEVKNKDAKYFVINDNKDTLDDFCVFKEDNWLTINLDYFYNKKLITTIFDYLKANFHYEYVSIFILSNRLELIKEIENYFPKIKKIKKTQKDKLFWQIVIYL